MFSKIFFFFFFLESTFSYSAIDKIIENNISDKSLALLFHYHYRLPCFSLVVAQYPGL